MKKAIYLMTCSCAILLGSCGDPAAIINSTTETERIPVILTENDLFKGNMILAFLENEDKSVQEANELFLKGLNAYRNEKDLDSADFYLRKSILKKSKLFG